MYSFYEKYIIFISLQNKSPINNKFYYLMFFIAYLDHNKTNEK